MNIQWDNGTLIIKGIEFDPQLTLIDSAQSFVWREHEGRYLASVFGEPISVELIPGGLLIYPVSELEVERYITYFDLARDYNKIAREYEMFPKIKQAIELLPGLRVLNQPTWDVLLMFIISANNNVARIKKLTWLLGEYFGEAQSLFGITLHQLPSPEVLAQVQESELRALGFGYRAPFLIRTAEMVRDGFPLDELPLMTYSDAHQKLLELMGVGDKVADCVQLFGCGHADAFPVDVWVERLMRTWFPEMNSLNKPKLQRASRELFGDNAGIAQQFLFHCARCGLMEL